MSHRTSRRTFLKTSALAAGAGLVVLRSGILQAGQSPNEKLSIACIGVGGRGGADLQGVSSETIVALCDVNSQHLDAAAKKHPKAQKYADWRKCLDQKDIDAVVCATTDHTHAFVNVWAMNRGKHVYSEKPLANSVHEARTVRETLAKAKVATQMGTQIHAEPNYRRVVELVQGGAIGAVLVDLGYCDQNPVPLEGATVIVADGGTFTLTTDENGEYMVWLDQGTYNVDVSADGHTSASAVIQITGQQTTTQDFDLRSLEPCVSLTPPSMESWLTPGS